jgi:hypothetical protein
MQVAVFFVRLIDDLDDVVSLVMLVGLLTFIGSKILENRDDLRAVGRRLAGGAFVAYLVSGFARFEPACAQDVLGITIRAAFCGALVLAWSWVLLGVVGFAQEYSEQIRQRASARMPRRPAVPAASIEDQQAAVIQRYERECRLIEQMKCPDDEKEARKRYADQKRMKALEELLK